MTEQLTMIAFCLIAGFLLAVVQRVVSQVEKCAERLLSIHAQAIENTAQAAKQTAHLSKLLDEMSKPIDFQQAPMPTGTYSAHDNGTLQALRNP